VGTHGEDVALDRFASRSLVLYLYPGGSSSPDGGNDSLLADAAQHRAFRDLLPELANRRFVVHGLSSETPQTQLASAVAQSLTHGLLSDPQLLLTGAMGLPTITVAGAQYYRRLTIVVQHGRISHVFFPVVNVQRSADQVLTWATVSGL
jgi:peroxiredoxin